MSDPQPVPRLNHVAISVPRELLTPENRAELLSFYSEIFGWDEMPTLSIDGERFVLRLHKNTQFLYLVADDEPMRCPKGDHFGVQVRTVEELDGMLERAKKFQAQDDRVEIIDKHVDAYDGVVKLHNFYVRYRLPVMVEVQCYDWAEQAAS